MTIDAMDDFVPPSSLQNRTYLNGHFLIAMPQLRDTHFEHSVVYVCSHSDHGAMGLVINRPHHLQFGDLLIRLGLTEDYDSTQLNAQFHDFTVYEGGPIERGRGFVLHMNDYVCEATLPIDKQLCVTSTTDILQAIRDNKGPKRALTALGYAGWDGGQLEQEIQANAWLTAPADPEIIFDCAAEHKYDVLLSSLGVDPNRLVADIGHA